MRFTCPSCSKSYRLSRDRLGAAGGAKIRCPNCKTLVRVQVGEGDKLIAQLAGSTGVRTTGGAGPARSAQTAARPAKQPASTAAKRPAASTPVWHVAVNQKAQGPLSIAAIQALIDSGEVTNTCLAWKKGLSAWKKIIEVPELHQRLNFKAATPAAQPGGAARSTLKTGAAHVPQSGGAEADSGDSRTQMVDVPAAISTTRAPTVPGGKAARRKEKQRKQATDRGVSGADIELAEARTLRPQKQAKPVRGGAMPRGKSSGRGKAKTPAVKLEPTGQNQAAATPAKKAPARRGAVKATAKAAPPPPAKKTASSKKATAKKGPAKKPDAAAAKAAANKPMAQAGGAAQSMAFFESGEQLMADVEFDLPDPNKHKPTKEEYANLLQEFSVMFRLDKRSKRQKAGIVVVLSLLVVGVISFGAILYLQGQKRQALIRDSKTILAVFSLPYQTSETVNLSQEAEQESAEFGEASTKKARRGTVQSSSLAEKLRAKVRGRRMKNNRTASKRSAKKRPKFKVRSAAELLGGQMDAAKQQAALVGASGRAVKTVSVDMRKEPTTQLLKPLCKGAMPDLRACAKAHAGDAAFKAKVAVSRDGRVTKVTARVDGKSNSALSSCAFGKMRRKRVSPLTKSASITCAVN